MRSLHTLACAAALIFTVPAEARGPMFLQAITLRVGPEALANEGGAHGARVSMQLFEVTGTARVHDNGTSGDQPARWDTFDPERAHTDDYLHRAKEHQDHRIDRGRRGTGPEAR